MKKILIIEDEIELRVTLRYLLVFSGYKVVEAVDGLDGLVKVRDQLPDLILCDIMMPLLDGYGFLEQHFLTPYAHIPVLLLSAYSSPDDEAKGLSLGAKEYIRKPFFFFKLHLIIRSYLCDEK